MVFEIFGFYKKFWTWKSPLYFHLGCFTSRATTHYGIFCEDSFTMQCNIKNKTQPSIPHGFFHTMVFFEERSRECLFFGTTFSSGSCLRSRVFRFCSKTRRIFWVHAGLKTSSWSPPLKKAQVHFQTSSWRCLETLRVTSMQRNLKHCLCARCMHAMCSMTRPKVSESVLLMATATAVARHDLVRSMVTVSCKRLSHLKVRLLFCFGSYSLQLFTFSNCSTFCNLAGHATAAETFIFILFYHALIDRYNCF